MPALASGVIVMWSGAIGTIPSGFVLCDGTLGTPDLRDRFIIGAGQAYAVDDTGGAVNHNHPFTGDGHTHLISGGPNITAVIGFKNITDSAAVTGTTNNTNHLPPYYALAYIMKT